MTVYHQTPENVRCRNRRFSENLLFTYSVGVRVCRTSLVGPSRLILVSVVESIQKKALKIILPTYDYAEAMNVTGLQCLSAHRQ